MVGQRGWPEWLGSETGQLGENLEYLKKNKAETGQNADNLGKIYLKNAIFLTEFR